MLDAQAAKSKDINERYNAILVELRDAISDGEGFKATEMIDRLIFYRNPLEKDYDHLLEKCIVSGKKVIALRPFAAGMAFQEPTRTAVDLIKYALGHECVAGTVFTATKSEHVDAIFLPNGEDERSRVWLTG